MKNKLILGIILATAMVSSAQNPTNRSFTVTPGVTIADNNLNGWATTFGVSGMTGVVTNISVTLNISGGFNGDLYAYLVDPYGHMAVLLNRVGLTSGNAYGYNDSGFNVTLSSDVGLQNINTFTTGNGGVVTGIFAADGRNIDPLSSPSVFDSALVTAGLDVFTGGYSPNGEWTFFIADLSGGGVSTLNSVMLTIITPEPQAWAILGGGFGVLWLWKRGKKNRKA